MSGEVDPSKATARPTVPSARAEAGCMRTQAKSEAVEAGPTCTYIPS